MNWRRAAAVCAVACAVTCAGCAGQAPVPISAAPRPAPSRVPWPERGVLREDARLLAASQVLDLAAGLLYALVPASLASGIGPYSLQAIDLRTGRVRRGESYPVSGLALASGYLWVYGSSGTAGRPVLDEADPGTLATARSVLVPGVSGVAAVAAGPAGTVWAGAGRRLLRVSVSTGAVLARAVLPPGLDLTDLAAGPGEVNLYASAARLRPGGAVVLEFSAGTGGLLAETGRTPLTWSAGGAQLAAVPAGVWVSFRTGMLGQSLLLSARSLSMINEALAGSAADSPVTGSGTVYSWAMGSVAAYGGGALWVATSSGLVACVNPLTGTVRSQGVMTSRQGLVVAVLAADPTAREVAAVVSDGGYTGVVAISPPRACWSPRPG